MSLDWQALAAQLGAAIDDHLEAASAQRVAGGSISAAWRIEGKRRAYFVKTNHADFADNFAAERDGLAALAGAASPAPSFAALGVCGETAYLALHHLDLFPLDAVSGRALGEQLAALHRHCADQFGWHRDNYIGATPQANTAHASWPHFFAHRRLLPQLALARERGLDKALVAQGTALAERIGGLFIDYRPSASLLHGDLWSGNAARLADGRPLLFDPACYYGDRETDIAMSELFGGFPESFYAAYRAAWPLDRGYETRKPLYNLYHMLNHYNLFGDAYLGQVRRMITQLAALTAR